MTTKIIFSLLLFVGFFSTPTIAQYKLDGNNLVLPTTIVFKNGSDHIESESDKMLDYLKTYLDNKSSVTLLRIESHVADAKTPEKAQSLSEKRAFAITKALVKRGVDCKRLLPVGFGMTKPMMENASATGKEKNTRIMIVNTQLRNKSISNMPIDGGGKVAGDVCSE